MPGCGRDGGFVTMILRLDHHLPRRPCTFLHEMGGFTHEWSLQLLPFDEGIYLMWKSFVKGQYLRWLRLLDWWLPVIAFINICQLPIFATKLWSYITFPKVKSNQLSWKSQIWINLVRKHECLVKIIKLGGWWWFEKILLEFFAHSPARLCIFVNSVFGRRASEWFSMRLNKSGC